MLESANGSFARSKMTGIWTSNIKGMLEMAENQGLSIPATILVPSSSTIEHKTPNYHQSTAQRVTKMRANMSNCCIRRRKGKPRKIKTTNNTCTQTHWLIMQNLDRDVYVQLRTGWGTISKAISTESAPLCDNRPSLEQLYSTISKISIFIVVVVSFRFGKTTDRLLWEPEWCVDLLTGW